MMRVRSANLPFMNFLESWLSVGVQTANDEGQVCQSAIYELSRILVVGWRPDSTNLSGAAADVKYIGTIATDLTSSKQRFLRILAGCASCAI
jgi:hypothetical protein